MSFCDGFDELSQGNRCGRCGLGAKILAPRVNISQNVWTLFEHFSIFPFLDQFCKNFGNL